MDCGVTKPNVLRLPVPPMERTRVVIQSPSRSFAEVVGSSEVLPSIVDMDFPEAAVTIPAWPLELVPWRASQTAPVEGLSVRSFRARKFPALVTQCGVITLCHRWILTSGYSRERRAAATTPSQ